MVYLTNALCLFETEQHLVQEYFPKHGKSKYCTLKILLSKDKVWEAFTPLRNHTPSISEVFLRTFVFFRLWQLKLFIVNYYIQDNFKDIMKHSYKKKNSNPVLFIFLPSILEKLRLLSYFQGIKYFMTNQNNFIFKCKRIIG